MSLATPTSFIVYISNLDGTPRVNVSRPEVDWAMENGCMIWGGYTRGVSNISFESLANDRKLVRGLDWVVVFDSVNLREFVAKDITTNHVRHNATSDANRAACLEEIDRYVRGVDAFVAARTTNTVRLTVPPADYSQYQVRAPEAPRAVGDGQLIPDNTQLVPRATPTAPWLTREMVACCGVVGCVVVSIAVLVAVTCLLISIGAAAFSGFYMQMNKPSPAAPVDRQGTPQEWLQTMVAYGEYAYNQGRNDKGPVQTGRARISSRQHNRNQVTYDAEVDDECLDGTCEAQYNLPQKTVKKEVAKYEPKPRIETPAKQPDAPLSTRVVEVEQKAPTAGSKPQAIAVHSWLDTCLYWVGSTVVTFIAGLVGCTGLWNCLERCF